LDRKKNIILNQLSETPFVEIFSFEELVGDTVFSNYQRYNFYQLIWFEEIKGDKRYFLDFNEYTLQDNQLLLVFPGQIDMMNPQEKKGYLFAIHGDVFFNINQHLNSDYLNGYFSNIFLTPDKKTKEILEKIKALLFEEYDSENRITLMQTYMEAFLFHVASLFEDTVTFSNRPDLPVAKLMRLVDNNFIHERESSFYAGHFGVSIKKINEISLRGTGKTVKQHLQERLILEIKKEIRLNRKSLKEIAFDLGFNEAAYFTRFFKQHTTMTPTEFRDS